MILFFFFSKLLHKNILYALHDFLLKKKEIKDHSQHPMPILFRVIPICLV
jgi:hypothetical protein